MSLQSFVSAVREYSVDHHVDAARAAAARWLDDAQPAGAGARSAVVPDAAVADGRIPWRRRRIARAGDARPGTAQHYDLPPRPERFGDRRH